MKQKVIMPIEVREAILRIRERKQKRRVPHVKYGATVKELLVELRWKDWHKQATYKRLYRRLEQLVKDGFLTKVGCATNHYYPRND